MLALRLAAQLFQHIVAGDAGQQQIQQDQIWHLTLYCLQSLEPRTRGLHPVRLACQVINDEGSDIRLILDD